MKEKILDTQRYDLLCRQLPSFCHNYLYAGLIEKSPATRIEYAKDLNSFFDFAITNFPYFPDKNKKDLLSSDLALITAGDINYYLSYLKDCGIREKTRARRKSAISGLFTYLINTDRVLTYNPTVGAVKIKIPKKDFVSYLTPDEQDQLINGIYTGHGLTDRELKFHARYVDRDLAIIFLFLDLGIRISELHGLDIKDVDLKDCSLVINRKGGKMAKLWFSDMSRDLLLTYLDKRQNKAGERLTDGPLFVTMQGTRLSIRAIEALVDKYISAILPQKASIISPHKLRSSFAMTYYRQTGGDILALQRQLGHESIAATNIYAKASEAELMQNRNWRQGL